MDNDKGNRKNDKNETIRDMMDKKKEETNGSGKKTLSPKLKFILGIIALVVFIAAAYAAYEALSERSGSGLEGLSAAQNAGNSDEPANIKDYDFTVQDGNGAEVKLSDFIGKPVVLNFWASWCPPCKSEMPHFDKLYGEIGNEVQFVMVDLVDGQRETLSLGKKFIANSGYRFPVFYDISGEAAYVFGISSIPVTVFIDREGNIITGNLGAMSENSLRDGIDLILQK
ncbi:MAG: TlpA disulfide reductase family protein [Eubacteriales bacterium]|nr:TlpA disulfide reductase family protein [Eubacteriales bacterium]